MNRFASAFGMVMCLVALFSCGGSPQPQFRKDSKGNTVPVSDYVCVAIDETFRPIFDILVKDFRDRNADAFTDPLFMPENDAIKLLLADSVRSIVVTRKLTGKEKLIQTMLEYGYSKAAICRKLKCNPKTLNNHLVRME